MGIENPLTAFNFDTRVGIFGQRVDGYLDMKKEKKMGKNKVAHVPKYNQKQAIRKATKDMRPGGNRSSSQVAIDLAMMAQGVDVIDS